MGKSALKNDFKTDLEYSLEENECELLDSFYHKMFPGLRDIEIVKDLERQKKGIDKVLTLNRGQQLTIDEKKRRENYGDILLELWSVWEERKRGWLYTCQCDYIVYAIMPTYRVYLLPTLLLKRAWLTNSNEWLMKFPEVDAENRSYTTKSIAIPPDILLPAILKEMSQALF